MTTIHTLASGSSGNAALICCGGTRLLLDAGISCRRITACLAALGLGLDDVSALLITHTHSDHIAGLQTLLKRSSFPIISSGRVGRELVYRLAGIEPRFQEIELCQQYQVDCLTVTAFPTSHDAPGSCGYRIDGSDGSIGILTDTGYVTQEAEAILPGVDLAVLEANHDVEALRSGPYPYYLKKRILGNQGHLCNDDAARFAVTLAEAGASEIVLAHLSRENNTPAMAQSTVERALATLETPVALSVAPRDTTGCIHALEGGCVCKK